MNKVSKILILIGLVFVAIALIISLSNPSRLITPFFSEESHHMIDYFSKEEVNEIIVDIINVRVDITTHSGNNVMISYPGSRDFNLRVTESDGVLSLKGKNRESFRIFNFNINFRMPGVKIMVPENYAIAYDIKTSNARINVNNIITFESSFSTSNAQIRFENIHSLYRQHLRTSNSKIVINHVDVYELVARTSNGRINTNFVDVMTSAELITSNSTINVHEFKAPSTEFVTSNGRINVMNLNSEKINLRNSNGRIQGTIIGNGSDFQKDFETSNSRIIINGNHFGTIIRETENKESTLKIKTSNGRIDIDFINPLPLPQGS